jgi:hypothetical protein
MMYGPELIISLKRKYGELYEVGIGSTKVLFRALTFRELDELSIAEDYTSSVESEELIVKQALLYPEYEELEKLSAGIISTLAEEIIEESCFFNIKNGRSKLELEREKANDVRVLMKAFIIAAMPAYKAEELDAQTFAQLANKVALAEQILAMNFATQVSAFSEGGAAPTLLLIDDDEDEEEERRRAAMHNLTRKEGAAVANDPIAG